MRRATTLPATALAVLLASAAALALLLAACGGGQGGGSFDESVESAFNFDRFEMRLTLDRKVYGLGEPVQMTLDLTNTHEHIPVAFRFMDAQRYDFEVTCRPPVDCPQVWQWSGDKGFIQMPGLEVVSPGRSLTYTAAWYQTDWEGRQVPPGTYEARGRITGCLERDPGSCDVGPGSVMFEILP